MIFATLPPLAAARPRRARAGAIALLAAIAAASLVPGVSRAADPPAAAASAPDYSRAEKLLFFGEPLKRVALPATVRYTFTRTGSLEPPFDDRVVLEVRKAADGKCCSAAVQFLTGERELKLPDIEQGLGNPVLLAFLDRDVRDMQRITKGQRAYYQKRIRMAFAYDAQVSDTQFEVRGRKVAGQRIDIDPYRDDPARVRYTRFANKTYQFDLSDAVPGGIVAIRSVMQPEAGGATPMILEELRYDGPASSR